MEKEEHNSKRLKQITKHLWDNRKSMSEQSFADMLETFTKEFYELGYCRGWKERSRIHRSATTVRRIRTSAAFNELYNEHSTGKNTDNMKPFTLAQLDFIGEWFKDNF